VDIEILKIKDITYFGKKWLTGELYKEMAYEGQIYTPEIIARFMNQLRDAKSKLESYDYAEAHGPQSQLYRLTLSVSAIFIQLPCSGV
jgi:type I restriction-modification system DNA methylase subunit